MSSGQTVVRLQAGDDTAEFDLGWGGRLRSLVAGGAERLLTHPPPGEEPRDLLWGCYAMAPWAGHIRDGFVEWRGLRIELPKNASPHSIHGLVYNCLVDVVDQTTTTLTTRCSLNWELGGEVVQRFALSPGTLDLSIEIVAGDCALPAWAGWHPIFRRPEAGDVRVRAQGAGVLELTADVIPTGAVLPVEGAADLSGGPLLGDRRLDTVYTEVREPAEIVWPDLRMKMTWRPPIDTLVVYTPAFCFCVEPQSAWPDAIRLAGVGSTRLAELERGQALRVSTRWVWSSARVLP